MGQLNTPVQPQIKESKMPISIRRTTDQHTAAVASLRFIVESTELVDSYSTDYLTRDGDALTVDLDSLANERVEHVQRTLAELDAVVSSAWEWALMEAVTPEARLRVDTVERARTLAAAIREALGVITAPAPTGIETTGQLARVTRSIIAGQPRAVAEVEVVEIDGDTLTYTTDRVWKMTATRSDLVDWTLDFEAEVAL